MKKIILLIFSLSILFSSCRKEIIDNPESPSPQSIDELVIESNFNWKTTKEIQLNLTAKQFSIVEVTNLNGIPFQKAFLKENEVYNMKLIVPSYEKSVRLKYQEQNIVLELTASTINYNFQ